MDVLIDSNNATLSPDSSSAVIWGGVLPTSTAHMTNVNFIVRARLDADQEIRILGDSPQLGNWEATRALTLVRESPDSTIWSMLVHLTSGVNVQYKYIIVSRYLDAVTVSVNFLELQSHILSLLAVPTIIFHTLLHTLLCRTTLHNDTACLCCHCREDHTDEPARVLRSLLPKGMDMWVDDEWLGTL